MTLSKRDSETRQSLCNFDHIKWNSALTLIAVAVTSVAGSRRPSYSDDLEGAWSVMISCPGTVGMRHDLNYTMNRGEKMQASSHR